MSTDVAELASQRLAPTQVVPVWHRAGRTAIAVAVAAGLGLHAFGSVDPINEMLSDTVASLPGALLLGLAAAALVVAAGCLAAGIRQVRPNRSPLLQALLAAWSVGLVALAVFPTNLPGTPLTGAAVVHRYGAAFAVVVPPLLGLLLARTRRLRTASWVTAGAAGLYGAAHGPAVLTGAEVLPYAGLAERILFGLILLLLVLIGRELRDRSHRTATEGDASWT